MKNLISCFINSKTITASASSISFKNVPPSLLLHALLKRGANIDVILFLPNIFLKIVKRIYPYILYGNLRQAVKSEN